ncbi:GGDEF domain-containing protein [Lacimicrobium alkaliphilum]|uniref:diguanylate cyclase n=1 Tax=Lacimicrobium alkaliphilum TaxID=1526571 RepID=A0A0U3AKN9_9ALTE|nr:GGDEF domain-containing protein [Lacimicrobium alkaliphilum]ALS98530.1 diguanylate cyclase [Lacimicrobium alkaliphilum]
MLYRLKNDFRLSIITLLGSCALLGITPFAIYRFAQGDIIAAIVDALILLSVCSVLAYAWISGDTRRSGLIMAIIACSGGLVVLSLQGTIGLFWLYPCFITSFFLTSSRLALLINTLTVFVLSLFQIGGIEYEHLISFITTAIVVSACAYVFSLRNESQRRRLEQLATLDPLTGVKNRRAMEEELLRAVATHERNDLSYGLAILDLDHFKRVNDEHGHAVGDQVLIECVDIISRHIRKSDRLFRFGGEEFVLLLPGVDDNGMRSVIRNLHKVLREELKSPSGAVTASYGLALLQSDENADQWMERADNALYQAKENGRDQIIVAPQPQLS